jgi:hypothetical protein
MTSPSVVSTSIPARISDFFSSGVHSLHTAFNAVRSRVSPAVAFLASKVQALWKTIVPYISKLPRYIMTPLGAALGLMGISLVPLSLACTVKSKAASVGLLAAGTLTAVAGGVLLGASGVLPAGIIPFKIA